MMNRKSAFLLFSLLCMGAGAQKEWHDPMEGEVPYVNGRGWDKELGGERNYHRIPVRFKDVLTPSVWGLSHFSAGLSISFTTDATDFEVRYTLKNKYHSYLNMAVLCHSGVDVYGTDAQGNMHWIGNHMNWSYPSGVGDTIVVRFPNISVPAGSEGKMRYDVYLPPYNEPAIVQIGVPQGSKFQFLREEEKPIVIYGSSIVNGASPSRPGLMWTTILKRQLGIPVYNFGFSGSALQEPAIYDMLREIDAKVYVLDPIPNSAGMGDEITRRAVVGVHKLREKSDAPILMVENYESPDSVLRRSYFEGYKAGNVKYHEAYVQLKKEGVKNLYYLYGPEIGFTEDAMIESAHPNDIGNMQYAQALDKKLRKILGMKKLKTKKRK